MGRISLIPAVRKLRRGDRRQATIVHVVAIAVALAVIALTAGSDHWNLRELFIMAAIAVISDLTAVDTGSTKLKVSGAHTALMLAAVFLGGGPAAVIGLTMIAVGWFRVREPAHYLLSNLSTFVWFPLIGGTFFHQATSLADVGPHSPTYYLLVFVTFVLCLVLNWLGIAGYQCYLDRSSLWEKARETLLPLLSADLFSALLMMGTVYVTVTLGTVGLALCGIVLLVFQYLIGELLKSAQRSRELHDLATTDQLTGLANRESFRARLEEEIAASGGDRPFSVMLMDLDHFKEVNDTLGHHYGDMLLRALGPRLVECVGSAGLVARLGGDEFAILLGERTADIERLEAVAGELLAIMQEPFAVDELSLEVGASLGIARFPQDGEDASTLMRRADAAMYDAKERQCGWNLYSAEHENHSARRLTVLSDFRRALSSDEIEVHFQPIVDLDNLQVKGAEGLVRWNHPELGLLAPGAFVQMVERTGLIGPMTRQVLERAIAECAAWRQRGMELSVAVNLSVRNLMDAGLMQEIERMLSLYGLPPEALKLEITESMLMSDPDRARGTVTGLSDLGVSISVDDFGTGYSSLANLRRLPINELKIDRSFVTPMLRDESDLIIVRSTINLAHDLGLNIIAEGVEDQLTMSRLAHLGCDLAQGYHVSRPLAPDAFTRWLGEVSTSGRGDLAA